MRISDWSSDVCSSDLVADRTAAWSSLHPLCWPQPSFRQRLQLRKNLGGGALNIFRKIDLDPRQTRDVFEAEGAWRQSQQQVAERHFIDRIGGAAIDIGPGRCGNLLCERSEEHTSELQSLMRTSYAVFCL